MQVRPTLDAILAILNDHLEIEREAGLVSDRSQPASHHGDVSARDHPLLDEWFQLWRGRPVRPGGAHAVARGQACLERLGQAVAATLPLVHVLIAEGCARQAGRWLADFHARISIIRDRASSEIVLDHVDHAADALLATGDRAALARRLGTAVIVDRAAVGAGHDRAASCRRAMVHLDVATSLRELQRVGRAVQSAAVRLEIARTCGPDLPGPDLARALATQTEGLRRNLRDFHLRPYLERAGHAPARPLSARFGSVLAAPMTTDDDLLAASARFLAIAATCLDDAQAILDATLAADPLAAP